MSVTSTNLSRNQYVAGYCLSDVLNFTRHFFFVDKGRKFLVGKHHRLICDKLNDVLEGRCKRLIINIAPRYGKTTIAVHNFIAAGLALNPKARFIHLSYSQTLAQDNSMSIKDIVNSEEYQRVFPLTRIKYGSDTKSRWDTEEGGGVYATSTLGQVTGFGAGAIEYEGEDYVFNGAIVIDDPIKPEDAMSDVEREKVNKRFETTIRNRVNSRNTPIVIIMQRLHEHDLCGYLQEIEPDEWEVLSLPSIYTDEEGEEQALWEEMHTLEDLRKLEGNDAIVFQTQHMQNPKPLEGLMYRDFKTYSIIPYCKKVIHCNCTDTADTGADYLCSICFDILPEGLYVTDVLYTKKPMEYTEQATAQMLTKQGTQVCFIESNNGGRGFGRNVERTVREYGNTKTTFVSFTQTKNKQVRIFTHSNDVNNMLIFPEDWESRWSEFARAMKNYRKEGGNVHDDAPDCATLCFEKREEASFYTGCMTDEELLRDFL